MINLVPNNWNYNEDLEMLFLFYQVSEEMLSEYSPDTYSLPLHNTYTLMIEIGNIYYILKKHRIVEEYYSQYVPVIIDEFLYSLEDDYVLKRILNKRLDSIKTGLEESKSNHKLLERWLDLFYQSCYPLRYIDEYKKEIEKLLSTHKKLDLIYSIKNYYVSLLSFGYTKKFIYLSLNRFFTDADNTINDNGIISKFFSVFDLNPKEYEFLVLMDTNALEYLDTINDQFKEIKQLTTINDEKSLNQEDDDSIKNLMRKKYKLNQNGNRHQRISIVQYKARSVDYIYAIEELKEYLNTLNSFCQYFKHYYPSRQVFMVLLKNDDNKYEEISQYSFLNKRPYIQQSTIDKKIKVILSMATMSPDTMASFGKALQMHSEAMESRKPTIILRNFWTALEALFSSSTSRKVHANFENDILNIIQKTYILKLLRQLYLDLIKSIEEKDLKDIGINNFEEFVCFFAKNNEDSSEMKKIYSKLSQNILLRTRLYNLRKQLSTGKKIQSFLEKHNKKIKWQIKRLYRYRNIATHIGEEVQSIDIAVNHIHNYFDYVVNYIICKNENGDYISNVASLSFEAQNDNRIQNELLKSDEELGESNYTDYLFGADNNLINYDFY